MSDRGFGFSAESFTSWRPMSRWWDNTITRGIMRSVIGSFAAVPMIVPIVIACEEPQGEGSTICFAIAVAGAALFIFTLRWFGNGRGVLWGLWLWLLSYGLFNSIVATASAIVRFVAWARGASVDEADIVATAIIGVVLFVLCNLGLKRADPDL